MTSAISNAEIVTLYVDSKGRSSGINENFTVRLNKKLTRVSQVDVVSVEIPFSYYVLGSNNNVLVFADGNGVVTPFTIPPGNYSGASLCDEFNKLLQPTIPDMASKFLVDTGTISFTTETTPFQILLSGSTSAKVIGLLADSPLGNQFVLQGIANLSGPNYLLVKSAALTKPKVTLPFFNTQQDNILYKVPMSSGPGTTVIEKNQSTARGIKFAVRQPLQEIDFQLVDPDGNIMNLNGQNWSMTLIFYIY